MCLWQSHFFLLFFEKTSQTCGIKVTPSRRTVTSWIYVSAPKFHGAKVQIGRVPEIRGDCGVKASSVEHWGPCPLGSQRALPSLYGTLVTVQSVCKCQRKPHISTEGPGAKERSQTSLWGFFLTVLCQNPHVALFQSGGYLSACVPGWRAYCAAGPWVMIPAFDHVARQGCLLLSISNLATETAYSSQARRVKGVATTFFSLPTCLSHEGKALTAFFCDANSRLRSMPI